MCTHFGIRKIEFAEKLARIHPDMQATSSLLGFAEDNIAAAGLDGRPPMRFKRFRGQQHQQARDDHDTVPILRHKEKETNTMDFERNKAETIVRKDTFDVPPVEAAKRVYENIILGDAESVEICVSESQSSLMSDTIASLNSQALSSADSQLQDGIESRSKSVSFSEPMVTSSWDIPKIESQDIKRLFYTSIDYKKFKSDRYGKEQTNPKFRDTEYCEKLVQNLDRIGADSFARGQYHKALEAFKHSLQIKTETFTKHDIRSTSATIHCIADVYSKLLKWERALDTYLAAFELLSRIKTAEKDDDARRWASTLLQKISTVQGYLDIVQSPSRESI